MNSILTSLKLFDLLHFLNGFEHFFPLFDELIELLHDLGVLRELVHLIEHEKFIIQDFLADGLPERPHLTNFVQELHINLLYLLDVLLCFLNTKVLKERPKGIFSFAAVIG